MNRIYVVCEELKAELKVTAQNVVTIGKVLQKEGYRKRGSYTWTIWTIKMILEQLVNGTPPEAISPNIQYPVALDMTEVRVINQELSSMNFIRSCRKIIRISSDILSSYCIGKAEQWDQLLSDGKGRHQTALKNLVIGVIDEEHLRPIILSTSIILKGENYGNQFDAVISTIAGCGKWFLVIYCLYVVYCSIDASKTGYF